MEFGVSRFLNNGASLLENHSAAVGRVKREVFFGRQCKSGGKPHALQDLAGIWWRCLRSTRIGCGKFGSRSWRARSDAPYPLNEFENGNRSDKTEKTDGRLMNRSHGRNGS